MASVMTKPGKGRPSTDAQKAAVIALEQEVVQRHAVQGQSFYRINADLGISDAGRVYRRAMDQRPARVREDAYRIQAERLERLYEQAAEAIDRDGLDPLAHRVAEIIEDGACGGEWEAIPERVRNTIERAYADTYRGIPVALGVIDRATKLDGLNHADRIADASLVLDQAKVQLMAGTLVEVLREGGMTPEQQRTAVTRWAELMQKDPDTQVI